MKKVKCCYKCPKRTMTCHSTCETYKQEAQEVREENEMIYKKRMEDKKVIDHIIATKNANEKKNRKK